MKKVNVFGVPMKYGCFLDGADMAVERTKKMKSEE